jgi:5'-nucleotidase
MAAKFSQIAQRLVRTTRKEKAKTMIKRTAPFKATFLVFVLVLSSVCSAADERPLRILVSNDDGIEAPGIIALAEALRDIGEVTVAAPRENRSGTSHGVTSDRPIKVTESEKDGIKWYAVDALPATCVRLAIEALLPERPDVVVTGINSGANLGTVTFYSATVAGAREAAFLGIPAVSFNLDRGRGMDFGAAARFARALVRSVAADGLPPGSYLNVNVPALSRQSIKGVRITRKDRRAPLEFYEKKQGEGGETVYIPSYQNLEPAEEGTDIWAVRNGFISLTLFTIDQTYAEGLPGLKALENLKWD